MNPASEDKPTLEALLLSAQALSPEERLSFVGRILDGIDSGDLPSRPKLPPPDLDVDPASLLVPESRLLYIRRVTLKETGGHREYSKTAEDYQSFRRICSGPEEGPHFAQVSFTSAPANGPERDGLLDVTLRPKDTVIAFDIFLLGFMYSAGRGTPYMARVAIDLNTGELRQHEIRCRESE